MTEPNALMTILEEMSQNSDSTSALGKLGKLLYNIPTMNAREIAVLWHLLEVCRPHADTTQSKEIVRAVRISLYARMRQIIHEDIMESKHGDVSQIMEIMVVNSTNKKKLGFWQRILKAA